MKRNKTNIKAMTVESTDDSGNFRTAILSALGKEQKCQSLSPYGLCSNPPDGSLGMAFNVQGIAANTVAIIDDPKNRKKGLAKGEVALVNYVTESFIYLKEDNSIEIESSSGAKVTLTSAGVIELNGNSDFVTAFTDMQLAFNALKTELNALITVYNSHNHKAVVPTQSTPLEPQGVPAVADMSAAKVATVKVP